ncbi:MAG TPA: ferritin family protein [Sedimentisphaerales bacterium]|nr:ferritin family protein [Sedimentisphaerales bacterium]
MTCFTAGDIFDVAEAIERNASEFYREAAGRSSDEETKKLLLHIASAEDGHLKTFQHMREPLSTDDGILVYEADSRSVMYLQTMADARGWEGRKSPLEELSGEETPRQIIEIALNSENESVAFYSGLRSLVLTEADKETVEKIILEELGHISALLKKLKSLG